MAEEEVVVVQASLLTAVGLSAAETAASVRGNVMGFAEIDWLDRGFEPYSVASVPDDGLPPLADALQGEAGLTTREERLLRLGSPALADCIRPVATSSVAIPLIVALPDAAGTIALDPSRFLRRLQVQTGIAFDVPGSSTITKGRAGGILALRAAHERLSAGSVRFLVAGGIDTYLDPYLLGTLDMEKRVKSEQNLDGFVPGEGAAFLLLTTRRTAQATRLTPLAVLTAGAEGFEKGHFYSDAPYLGDGLATTFQTLLSHTEALCPVLDVYSSMNGESHWAKEWGVALIRNSKSISDTHFIHHPADCYGDLGAAAGPAMAALATAGFTGQHRNRSALIYASSDRGERAAIGLLPPQAK